MPFYTPTAVAQGDLQKEGGTNYGWQDQLWMALVWVLPVCPT